MESFLQSSPDCLLLTAFFFIMTLPNIETLLKSSDFMDKMRGINMVRSSDPAIAFPLLLPLVKDTNARIRYAAVSQFDTVGNYDRATSLEILRDRLLRDSEIDVKSAAADSITALKLTEAFDDLILAYHQSGEWLLQLSILAGLGEMGDPRGYDILITALNSDNALLVTTAIGSLGELGDQRAIPHLIPLIDNEDWQVRYRLAQALGLLGGEQVRSTLEKLSQDEMEQVSLEAKHQLNS